MIGDNVYPEKRKDERFGLKIWVFAAIQCGEESKIGMITDISRSGLAIRSPDENEKKLEQCCLAMVCSDEDFRLLGVPIRVVSCSSIKSEYSFSFVPMKRYGVQFGKLTDGQRAALDFLISGYSVH